MSSHYRHYGQNGVPPIQKGEEPGKKLEAVISSKKISDVSRPERDPELGKSHVVAPEIK
jgi:hypothetical protein